MSETRAARIAAALRDAIQSGQYASGERLIELHLMQQFGVSQTLIREALALLEQEGWVSKQERRGVFIRAFTLDEIRQIIGLAAAIEAEILHGWTAWSVTTVERALAELRAHWHAALLAQRDDPASAFMRLLDLHAAVSQPGTVAAPLHRSLINQLRLIELHTQAVRPRPIGLLDAHIQGHEYALAALRQGDSTALPEALRAVSGDYLYR